MRRLRALYLTHHGPMPASSGGRLRDAALIPELANFADVEVWAVSRTAEQDRSAIAASWTGPSCRIYDDEGPLREFPTRESRLLRQALAARMASPGAFDVIHIEGHYLHSLVPDNGTHERVVLVEHNVESHVLEQRLALQPEHVGLRSARALVEEAERRAWRAAPLILALSEEDRARILQRIPEANVAVSTNGADHVPRIPPDPHRESRGRGTIGFLANYRYPPNQDALTWLVERLFPAIKQRLHGGRLILAGSNLQDALVGRPLPEGVVPVGWMGDLSEFWQQCDVVVCPLRVGGGVKVKVIEAIQSGAVVVSTPVGLEGLSPAGRDAIIQAESEEEFVEFTVRACVDSALRFDLARRVARAQESLTSWAAVAEATYRHWTSVAM